jgi:heptosyltransferase I
MTLSFKPPPRHVCLLRLSAIGDTCHALAALRAFQAAWPQTRFTWIIGKLEAKLMTAILPEIEFITFDKGAMSLGNCGGCAVLRGRRFDLLLDLQLSFRASLVSTLVAPPSSWASIARARASCSGCSPTRKSRRRASEHVLDSFMGFARACGIEPGKRALGRIPARKTRSTTPAAVITDAAHAVHQPLLQPCGAQLVGRSAMPRRRSRRRHARHARGAGRRAQRRGERAWARPSPPPRAPAHQSNRQGHPAAAAGPDGQSTVLLSPDSGPAHMATMVGLPVIGLYAATNPARAGPTTAAPGASTNTTRPPAKFYGKPGAQIPWTTKIERPGVMDLIAVDEVTANSTR